jgi:pimeloyl-ACP methyl ester carboxylesterase
VSVAYRRVGSGEPLLLIHGLGGVGHYWDPLLDDLCAAYDVIVVDLPGFGDSPTLSTDVVTAGELAAALAGLLDQLDLDTVHVVGHSLGGVVAFELGALGRARTITGLAPAGLWEHQHQATRSRMRLRLSHHVVKLARPVTRPFVQVLTRLPVVLPRGLTGETARALYESYSNSPGFEPVLRGIGSEPFTKGDQLTMPVTVVWGTRDTVILAQDRDRGRLPAHTRWIELDGAGHNVPWERHKEVMSAINTTIGALRAGQRD